MCLYPKPFKCKCPPERFFNRDKKKCETLLEINETCLQVDSCKNGSCIGSPPKCKCSNFQYFDPISGQCQNQLNLTG